MSEGGTPLGGMSAIKLALLAANVRRQAAAVLSADPIAVVGMGCRLPGAPDVDAFWDLLVRGVDATREVPADRWDAAAWYDPDVAAPGKSSTMRGGFLDRVDLFDAGYFRILPREAERMDPQQRLLLEVAVEALDAAGLSNRMLAGSRSGVFIASYHSDYARLMYSDPEWIDARTLTGAVHSVVANRLSYLLDLRGPSVSIDTACSSSLVAAHLACQSLRSGECDVAIAGGVSLMVAPELMVAESKVGFMAPDGRCKPFDAAADGFGRGEGCGVVVLKRLSDAVADGDTVLAVVRGSAVNQDGYSTVLTAPNGPAQEAMIREALANAALDGSRIGFVEAHGTGTALGDPIEVEALAATVGRPAAGAGTCYLGAAKANIAHLEAAAGITGFIKAVLTLQREAIPPQPNFTRLNPHISLEGTRLQVATALTPWPRGETPRCAATSSFGIGGTNAHVILEEAPSLPQPEPEVDAELPRILPLSARSAAALDELVGRWREFLATTAESAIDLCYTASERRTHHEHRIAVLGRNAAEWCTALANLERGGAESLAAQRHAPPRIAFVFSGQGPQWYAMGRELYESEPVFRESIDACDAALRPVSGWSLLDALRASEDASRLHETVVAQPALFAIQVALAALWRSWGIVPQGVIGHSVGEIAALTVAGVLSLDEACRIVWHRGRIMQDATGRGRMASVALGPDEAAAVVQPFGARLSVAAINAPNSVVLSGDEDALAQALDALTARGVRHRMLPVSYAFHSTQMIPFAERLEQTLGTVRADQPAIPVYSTVTGALASGVSFDASYFARNVREPVRLASGVDAMLADGFDAFVEIAPHPVLGSSIHECMAASDRSAVVVASLRRERPERETMLQACAALYCAGALPEWSAVQRAPGRVVQLPAYPWQRSRYWLRPRSAGAGMALQGAASGHPLLGRRLQIAHSQAVIFEGSAAAARAWLADHRVFDRVLLPGAAVMEAFAAAAEAALGAPAPVLIGFAMHRPLAIPEDAWDLLRWQIIATPAGDGGVELELAEAVLESGEVRSWRTIASARGVPATLPMGRPNAREGGEQLAESIEPAAVTAEHEALGLDFGPSFCALRSIRRGRGEAEAWIELSGAALEGGEAGRHLVHPTLIDAALQVCALAARADGLTAPGTLVLPVGAESVRLDRTSAIRLRARGRLRERGPGSSLAADVTLETEEGRLVAVIEGMQFAPADRGAFQNRDLATYELVWERAAPAPHRETASLAGTWLVLADASGAGDELARELTARGGRCHLVLAGNTFAQENGDRWIIDPAEPEHFARVLAGCGSAPEGVRGVVHLWNLDTTGYGAGSPASDASERDDLLGVGSLLYLAQQLGSARSGSACPVWVVTRGAHVVTGDENAHDLRPSAAGAWALADVIASEHPELRVRRLDLDPAAPADVSRIVNELARGEASAWGVALRDGSEWRRRLVRREGASPAGAGQPSRLTRVQPGSLDGVALRPFTPERLAAGEVRVRVSAAGVNFRDVLVTLGMYPGAEVPLGAECAGVVSEVGPGVSEVSVGDRVFGFAVASLATEVVVPAAFLARVPDALDDATAAGVPVAFLTAYYGLHRLARMTAGDRVLIHAATGGVGMAAVQLAQRAGAEIFATAGSTEKRALLRSMGVQHVMDSRSLAFADEIRRITGGRGVDIVLNSLAGDFIGASLGVLAQGGRFLELGKRGVMSVEQAAAVRPDVQYHVFDLGAEAQADHALLRPMFDEILAGLKDGSLRPLPTRTYPIERASEAFRLMAQAGHVGKLVLVTPRAAGFSISAQGTYLITGGLGAIGFATARWLAEHGARTLVLTGRHAPSAERAEDIRKLESSGVAVHVFQADASDPAAMRNVFDAVARSLPPLRGVVHAAGVLADGVLLRQTWAECRPVLRSKAHGAWILHELTHAMTLDFFVLYSAGGVVLGAPGQGVYPAANAELDALAAARRRDGLPALSVAWGVWGEGGMAAAAAAGGHDVWRDRGLLPFTPAAGFAALERLLAEGAVHAAVMDVDWSRFLARLPAGVDPESFRGLGPVASSSSAGTAARADDGIVQTLRALPVNERRDALARYLETRARQAIGLPDSVTLDWGVPLREVGLDSLMAVELRNALTRSLGRSLPATISFDYPTLNALTDHLGTLLDLIPERREEQQSAGRSSGLEDLSALTEEEAAALLLAELEPASPPPRGRSS